LKADNYLFIKFMKLINSLLKRVKTLNIFELKLFGLVGICIGVIVAKLWTPFYELNYWWFIGVGSISYLWILYALLFRKIK